jgi:hypothetical protein
VGKRKGGSLYIILLTRAHKYGYYEQVMTQLACSEEKGATLIIWTKLCFIDLPILG